MSSSGKWEQILPRFSLNRRVTVLVIMMTALVVGVVATIGIPLELVPRGFENPQLMVRASWHDASPRDVLDKLAVPLEEELSTVRGLDQVSSLSSTGRVQVFLRFKQGTDMNVAYRELRDRILRARTRMPDDIDPIRILKQDESSVPILVIGVAIDPTVTDSYNLIQREIVKPLQRVDGVASVRSQGLQEKEVLIELDRDKTSAAGLNIYLVAQQLAGDNFSMASGAVHMAERKLLLRSLARYRDLAEVREQLITPNVRVSDIATVRYAEPEKLWRVRVNSKPALAVEVYKEGQANTIEVGDRLEDEFARIQANPKLATSDTGVLFAQAAVIQESLSTLLDSGQVGALLAAAVLLFFLRRLRMTLVITLSIPLSMVIALTAMYFAGETLNILSLLGLIISVGLLVDNSVVVAENITRHYRGGATRRDACIEGTSEIALAVILATLTTIVVFLPVALVEGRGQFFLLRLAIPLTVSLGASLFVALIFIPLCVYATLGERSGESRNRAVNFVHAVMDRTLGTVYRYTVDPLNRAYAAVLAFFLRRRFDLVFLVVLIFAITLGGPAATLEIVDVSEDDRKDFDITVEMPSNYNLEDAEAYFTAAEHELEKIRAELDLEGFFIFHLASWGRLQGWFPGRDDLSRRKVTDLVMKRLPERPGVKLYSGRDAIGEEADTASEHGIVINGENPDVLDEVADRIEELGLSVSGVIGVKQGADVAPNELALMVDRDRAGRAGLNPQLIAGAVAIGLRGQPLPRLHWQGKVVPVRIRFREEDRRSLAELANFDIPTDPTGQGQDVQLSSVTDVRYLAAANAIVRQDKRISQRITFQLAEGSEQETHRRLDELMAGVDLPEGVRFGASTAAAKLDDEVDSLKFAALISVVFVYLLMGFLFESFVLPLSIILTIPLATIGVLWTHFFAGRDLDFLGFIGVILLIGVVVNNGIVFIDYAQRLRAEGYERTRAVLLTARRRFRPIMMTAGSTVCGMIPLTLGPPTSIGISYRSFGLALIGGMVTATALTLLVVPVFYTLLDDARNAFLAAVRGRGTAARAIVPPGATGE